MNATERWKGKFRTHANNFKKEKQSTKKKKKRKADRSFRDDE